MKNIVRKIILVLSAAALCLVFVACGNSYVPESTESYFVDGDVCRVFSLESEEQIADYGLHSDMVPMTAFATAEIKSTTGFNANSMFFEDASKINRDGVIALYEYMDISTYSLADERFDCNFTNLHSYNTAITFNSPMTVNISGEPQFTVYGAVADVTKYTFKYEDRSRKDGKVVSNGSFSVLISDIVKWSKFVLHAW